MAFTLAANSRAIHPFGAIPQLNLPTLQSRILSEAAGSQQFTGCNSRGRIASVSWCGRPDRLLDQRLYVGQYLAKLGADTEWTLRPRSDLPAGAPRWPELDLIPSGKGINGAAELFGQRGRHVRQPSKPEARDRTTSGASSTETTNRHFVQP